MEKLSVVIPVYNVEAFLEDCLNTVINQTYKNLEIIIVDDGATDNSGKICDEYAKKDERIIVYHKENGGLSDARNYGIKKSTCKYIAFIDSDDYIDETYFEVLYNNLEKNNADISICFFNIVYNYEMKKETNPEIIECLNVEKAIDYMNDFKHYDISAPGKLFKKEIFDEIEFPVGKTSEDWYIIYKLFDKANRVVYTNKKMYYYRQRKGSITKKATKINMDPLYASKEAEDFIREKYPNIVNNAILKRAIANMGVYNDIILRDAKEKYNKESAEIMNFLKENQKIIYNGLQGKKKIQFMIFIKLNKIYDLLFPKLYRVFKGNKM